MNTTPNTTLVEAKQFLLDNLKNGAVCPCCNRYNKVYKRKLNKGMAAFLVKVASTFGTEWFHINNDLSDHRLICGGDYSKLRYWGLFEPHPKLDDSEPNGQWRITERGLLFVRGEIEVPRACFVLNNVAIDFSIETTDINTALGDKLNLSELTAEVSEEEAVGGLMAIA